MNRTFSLLLPLVLFLLTGCSDMPEENRTIVNRSDARYVTVPGTNVGMIPPPGFKPAPDFWGFRHDSTGAVIRLMEIDRPIEEVAAGASEERLKSGGIELLKREELTINGMNAVLIDVYHIVKKDTVEKLILTVGDREKSWMVHAQFRPQDQERMRKPLRDAILSIVVDRDRPLGSLPFQLDVEGTPLQYAGRIAGSPVYTCDAKIPTENEEGTMLFVAPSWKQVMIRDRRDFAVERLKAYEAYEKVEPKSVEQIDIHGLPGYEIVARGRNRMTGKEELLYQTALFDGEAYFLIVGSSAANFDRNLETFRTVARSFRREN